VGACIHWRNATLGVMSSGPRVEAPLVASVLKIGARGLSFSDAWREAATFVLGKLSNEPICTLYYKTPHHLTLG